MQRWVYRVILLGLMFAAALPLARHAAVTSDGPVHVAFANLMATMPQAGHPLQQQAYTINSRPTPNLAVYLLLSALMRVSSPDIAESVVQILCLIAPVAACWFAIGRIDPKNVWLAVFVLPLSINQMFFLGLYNHCLSTAAFFLAIGTYFWMVKAPSILRALALAVSLMLTFFCHASGFIMAFAGIATMAAVSCVIPAFRDGSARRAIRRQIYTLVALLAPLPLAVLFLASGPRSGDRAHYGVSVLARLRQFFTLQLLAVNLPRDTYIAQWVAVILLVALAYAIVRMILRRKDISGDRLEQVVGALAAALVSAAIMMLFPDNMGGGWTHFRRFEVFPYFWALLVLAFESFPMPVIGGMIAAGSATGLVLVSSVVSRQDLVREQAAPLAEVDHRIGSHCTVLPIVFKSRPDDNTGNPVWMTYGPYFQAASRLELTGDRVVLFNFLARLNVYPVRFRPNIEPQEQIFHWKPRQEQTAIKTIDVEGFERASNIRVDAILLWTSQGEIPEASHQQFANAVAQFNAVYTSSDGSMTLYRRKQGGNSLCTIVAP